MKLQELSEYMPTPKERMKRLRERYLNADMSEDEYNRAMSMLLDEESDIGMRASTKESLFTRILGKLFY
jgi:hypothetical protein